MPNHRGYEKGEEGKGRGCGTPHNENGSARENEGYPTNQCEELGNIYGGKG